MQQHKASNPAPGRKGEKQATFSSHAYPFPEQIQPDRPFAKTSLSLQLSGEQIQLLTRLYHQNLVGLRKIGKLRKTQDNSQYLLYYETVPYSLAHVFNATRRIDITPEALESALFSLKNYLVSLGVHFELEEKNVGVSEHGVVKVYIDPVVVLTRSCSQHCLQACDAKIRQIKVWYSNIYSRKSLKPSQLPKATSDKKLLVSFSNGQGKQSIPHLRKQMKSSESKNPCPSQEPSECNELELYSRINAIRQNERKQQQQRLIKQQMSKNVNQVKPQYKNGYEFDNESVDTYQLQMGEDYEMPSIRTNQKLRQSFVNNKPSWDTLTHKGHPNNRKESKVHESAGKKDWVHIIDNNRNKLKQSGSGAPHSGFDSKTVQEAGLKAKNWQNSTIKSTANPDIKDRVQQALIKTKNVMQLLKKSKNFAAK